MVPRVLHMKCFLKFAALGVVGVVLVTFLFHHTPALQQFSEEEEVGKGWKEGRSELRRVLQHSSIKRARGKVKGNQEIEQQSLKNGYVRTGLAQMPGEDGGVKPERRERGRGEVLRGEDENLVGKEGEDERREDLLRQDLVAESEEQRGEDIEQLNGKAVHLEERRGDVREETGVVVGREGNSAQASVSQEQIDRDNAKTLKNMKITSKRTDIPMMELKTFKHYPYFSSPYPAAKVGNHVCSDSICSDYLGEADKIAFKFCVSRTIVRFKLPVMVPEDSFFGSCRFMDGSHRAPVALASMPGSGNTWVRGLLQQATGICTGAIYCDPGLRLGGFNGERIVSGAVIAIKTHHHHTVPWTDVDKPREDMDEKTENPYYGAAILIIRNPFDAMVADYQRFTGKKISSYSREGGNHHTDILNNTFFGSNPKWSTYVISRAPNFRLFFSSWVVPAKQGNHPLLVIRYEDLKNDTYREVRKMLDFLKIDYSPEELRENLAKDFSNFKRKTHADFDHFTSYQRELVRDSITKALTYLRAHNNGITYGVESYLDT